MEIGLGSERSPVKAVWLEIKGKTGPLSSGEFVGGQAKGKLSWGGLTPQLFFFG